MVKFSSGLKRQKTKAEELSVYEDMGWRNDVFGGERERERDGFVGFEREEEGKRNLGVLAAMGDGKEIFCRKIGFWLCVVELIVSFVKCSSGTSGLDSVKLSFTPNPCWI